MIQPPRNSYGYRNLLVYKKAEELQLALAKFISEERCFKTEKTLVALADQMERSARSTKQNIIEGWKRNSTPEYYQFLGYAVASNAELEADCTDICIGIYESKGLKGVERGEKGQIESVPFYPLNPLLPLPLQLKLRAKELNFLLDKLQNSLLEKMKTEKTISSTDMIRASMQKESVFRKDHEVYLKERGWD
jgi:four helix bundle protein